MLRVDSTGARGHDRHRRLAGRELGQQLPFDAVQERAHVADRAVAEERHGAVRDAAARLDLRPPHPAVPEADPGGGMRLRDDHVVDPRPGEPTPLGEVRDPGVAAQFLIDRAGDLERALEPDARGQNALQRDHRSREPALHVAGAAAVQAAALDHARERVDGPAPSGLDHVDVAVEVHARAGPLPLAAGDHVEARIALAVAKRAFGPDVGHLEAGAMQPFAQMPRAGLIGFAGRIDRREAHQLPGKLHQRVPLVLDAREQVVQHSMPPEPDLEQAGRLSICALQSSRRGLPPWSASARQAAASAPESRAAACRASAFSS